MATKAKQAKRVDTADIRTGDIFSEISHYQFKEKTREGYRFLHLESKEIVTLGDKYVEELLSTADQYHSEVEVGKEDKLWTEAQINEAVSKGDLPKDLKLQPRVGDVRVPGIRSIWESIHSSQVFTVWFKKADKPLTGKKLKELRESQIQEAVERIEKARTAKKGVASIAAQVIKEIQDNPILPTEEGEVRMLRGYKIQFTSRDGRYDVIDMDLQAPDNVRPVNINTLSNLVFAGVKYTVK